jgi:anti-sigma B factor antagonist
MTVMDKQRQSSDTQTESVRPDYAVHLTATGDIDMATASRFTLAGQEALTGHTHTTLTIDMSQVTFIDAAGIAALVAIRHWAQLNDNIVAVTEPSPCVRRLLDLTSLTRVFTEPPELTQSSA